MSVTAYKQALQHVSIEEAQAQQAVNQGLHAKSVLKLRAALTKFAADQTTVAAQLGTLHPPANAVAANAALANAFVENANGLHELLGRIDHAKTVKQAMAIIQSDKSAQKSGQDIDAALKKLRLLGYTSGS
jgi:hypothetical protein